MAKGKSGGLNSAMKSVGRNMARANNQASSAKVPAKFASGGPVGKKVPAGKDMGSYGGSGMDKSGFGSGKARGGGAATKGTKFSGTF